MSHFHITLNLILGSEVIKVVISVNDYKQIRQRYLNGESQRSIAKSMGISRNTVKKYCEGENVPWERKTPEREAVVVFPTPPFWFVRAITLQFDIGASSFRINLATLSRWLCNSTRERKKAAYS